jgi:hypothetical protein
MSSGNSTIGASLARFASLLMILCGCSSDENSGRPSRAQCEAAQAHEAELIVALAASPTDDARHKAELAEHQANLATVGGAEAIDRCIAHASRARLACVMKAASRDELARCPAPSRSE